MDLAAPMPASLAPAAAAGLVACRLGGLAAVVPGLAGSSVPVRVRVAAVVALAACVAPVVLAEVERKASGLPATGGEFLAAAVAETAIGAALGFVALVPLLAYRMGGTLLSQQMGLGFARLYDPNAGEESDAVERLLFLLGITAFLAAGGLEATVLATAGSYGWIGLGGAGLVAGLGPLEIDGSLPRLLAGLLLAGFDLALRVALPTLGLFLGEALLMGTLARGLPTFHLLGVGFPLRILLGLGALLVSLGAMQASFRGWLVAEGGGLAPFVRLAGGIG